MSNHNKLDVDLTNCDREPIHLVGNIQAHGFLLILDKESLVLEQGSENCKDFLGIEVAKLPGKSIEEFVSEEQAKVIQQSISGEPSSPRLLEINGRKLIAFIHESAGKIVLEGEPSPSLPEKEVIESSNWLSDSLTRLNELESLESTSGLVADRLQSILDYDRVLVFRFDQDWHAEVIAEKIKTGIHSFRGHHFPASDIPAPARALLELKHIRHIPDVKAPPSAVLPYLNPSTQSPTDILQSELRYPSEIHLEYLRNMNVASSLSFSLMVKGKLWGLISCTNESPVFTNFRTRQLCNQLIKAFSNILISTKEKRDFRQFQEYKEVEKKLVGQLIEKQDIFKGLHGKELNLLNITESSGAAIILDKQVIRLGVTPEEKQVLEIVHWLSRNNVETVFQTRELSSVIKSAEKYQERACGLLALEISRFSKEYILYFKPEIKEKRIWAGNPEKPVAGEDFRIHPRKSFEKWEELIKGKSQPWSMNEQEIAHILQKDIMAVRLSNQNRNLEDLNEEYQTTADGLRIKNEQLEDFTRIITHNLRSPLVNIQALYSLFKNNPEQANANLFLEKIKQAGDNMLATIDDLNLILKIETGNQLKTETVDLKALIDKELNSLEGTILDSGAEIDFQLLAPEVNSHKVYMESIIHNLVSNALKYTYPDRKPEVKIKSWKENNTFNLSVSDNGVGLDLDKYGHKLFGIYQTFHSNPHSRGVGLYLTKMQVESLGGRIEVESEPGKGTTFTVSLGASRSSDGE